MSINFQHFKPISKTKRKWQLIILHSDKSINDSGRQSAIVMDVVNL